MQKKILIIYHSGSGSTRTISEVLEKRLSLDFDIEMLEIHADFNYKNLLDYNIVLIGFPTYYFRPPDSILEFVKKMPVFEKKIKTFIYTTYAMYSGNSIRVLAMKLKAKNMVVSGYMQIRGPASDGVLLLPSYFKFFFRYERKANIKIDRIIGKIKGLMEYPGNILKIPRMRWYSPATRLFSKQINGIGYSSYKKNLKILEGRCTKCNICVNNCIRNCWIEGKDFPSINISNCEFCLKCVHNCPVNAIVFTDSMKDRPRFNKLFYKKLKQKTF